MKGAIASYYDALNVRELLVRKTPGDDKLVQSFVDIRGKLADVLIPGESESGIGADSTSKKLEYTCANALVRNKASDGGMIGAGGGVCAIDWIATVNVVSVIAPAMAFRISSSRYYFAIKNVSRIVRAADRATQP